MTPAGPFQSSSTRSGASASRRAGGALAFSVAALLAVVASRGRADRPVLVAALRESLPKDRLYPVPFDPGETLVYTIAWLKIEGGEMTLSTARLASADGVPVHHIALTAESNDYISKFYPVRTRYETWVDGRDFQPLRFEKHAREGRYESDEVEEFDLAHRIGSWRQDRTHLPERVQDIISSFYYLRSQTLVPGKDILLDMFSRGKIYKLMASVQVRETVETDAGTFQAIRVQPQLRETESEEDRNKGKLFVWISDDPRHLPVMAKTLLPIGSVTARLKKIVPGEKPKAPEAAPPPVTP